MGMASGLMIGPFTRLASVTEELANVRRTVCCLSAESRDQSPKLNHNFEMCNSRCGSSWCSRRLCDMIRRGMWAVTWRFEVL
jgi:hypothetical protein